MKCFELQNAGGLDALKPAERPDPKPGPGQVVVRVRAASFNYRDVMVASGGYGFAKFPLIPMSDGAGDVAAVGPGVTRVKVGDKVCGIFFQRWITGPVRADIQAAALGGSTDGMLTDHALLEAEGVTPYPAHLSYEEAAALPCAAVTAWNGLIEASGGIKPGDAVLLLGTGGVSIFGLQFATAAGARAIVVSSSDEKLAKAKAMGAAAAINSKTMPEWQDKVREATDGRGVDHVLDVTGGETTQKSLVSLRPGGHIAIIGARSGPGGELDRRQILQRGIKVSGINVGSRAMFEAMNRAITANKLKPVVDRVFPFRDTPAAYREFATGKHFGKVVIAIE